MKKILLILTLIVSTVFFYSCDKTNNAGRELEQPIRVEENKEAEDTQEIVGDFGGYMWSVAHEDSEVYLFGSIHMAHEDLYPFAPQVEEAFETSDHLVVEADPTDMSQLALMVDKMTYKGTETVYDHLTDAGVEKFEAICLELGIKPQRFEKIQVWALGSNLMSLQLMKAGYDAESGVDVHFLERAKKAKMDILELEGSMFQINLLSSFEPLVQEEMFLGGLGTTEASIAEFETLYKFYLAGDHDQMTDYLMTEEISAYPEVEAAMLDDRNVGMADKIEAYLQTEDQYFLVVGLAHLLGDKSVVKLLEDRGYTVNRIDK